MLQFKATVRPKVASESTYEAQNFQNFLGDHPSDHPNFLCIPYCKRVKAGQGLGTRLFTDVVHPRCARHQLCSGYATGKGGRESEGAGVGGAGQKEEARVSLSKYKPVESYILSWRVLGMSTLPSMLHTTVSTEF